MEHSHKIRLMQAPIVTFSYGHRRCSYILPLVNSDRVFMELGIPTQFAEVLFDISSIEIVDPEKIVCNKLEIVTEADVIDAVIYKVKLPGYVSLDSILRCISCLRESHYFISKIGDPVTIRGPYEAHVYTQRLLDDNVFSTARLFYILTISGSEDSPIIYARLGVSDVVQKFSVLSVYPGGIDKSTVIKCARVVQFYNPKNLIVLDHGQEDTETDVGEYTLEIKFRSLWWFIDMLLISISIDAEVKPGRQKSANK